MIGPYTLISHLGGGAMGTVWTVRDQQGGFEAMKILRTSLPDDQTDQRDERIARERFRREGMALSRIRHPGVAAITDMELDEPIAYIVTELIDGDNLRDDVEQNGAYVGDDLELLAEKLISAVQAVHEAGIIHRDIKPTNVMISATGPVLVDFGIAMGAGDSHVTRTGLVMGTPGFIAPEVIEGADSDAETDWWALAAVLAYAATGRAVFGTKPIMTVLEREAAGSADLRGLSPRVRAAFTAALNPVRAKRCTIGQLLAAIQQDAVDRQTGTQAGGTPFSGGAGGNAGGSINANGGLR